MEDFIKIKCFKIAESICADDLRLPENTVIININHITAIEFKGEINDFRIKDTSFSRIKMIGYKQHLYIHNTECERLLTLLKII
jgi:hypothetical protein